MRKRGARRDAEDAENFATCNSSLLEEWKFRRDENLSDLYYRGSCEVIMHCVAFAADERVKNA